MKTKQNKPLKASKNCLKDVPQTGKKKKNIGENALTVVKNSKSLWHLEPQCTRLLPSPLRDRILLWLVQSTEIPLPTLPSLGRQYLPGGTYRQFLCLLQLHVTDALQASAIGGSQPASTPRCKLSPRCGRLRM